MPLQADGAWVFAPLFAPLAARMGSPRPLGVDVDLSLHQLQAALCLKRKVRGPRTNAYVAARRRPLQTVT